LTRRRADLIPTTEEEAKLAKTKKEAVLRQKASEVELILEEAKQEAGKQAASMVKLAAAALRKQLKHGTDERATYSAAAKIFDMVNPKVQAPLVSFNFGDRVKSHLRLPAAPPTQIELPPAPKALYERREEVRPEDRVIDVKQIGPERPSDRTFRKKADPFGEETGEPEPKKDYHPVTDKPDPEAMKGVEREEEEIPQAQIYDEARR
jgi:hypothetical protein